MIEFGNTPVRVVDNSAFWGNMGIGWPQEQLDILRGRLKRRQVGVAQVSKTSTAHPRGEYRFWKYWRYVGYVENGMRNRHSFTNPGIASDFWKLELFCYLMGNPIISVSGWIEEEIDILADYTNRLKCIAVEVNVSCKNVPLFTTDQAEAMILRFKRQSNHPVIVKVGEDCLELAKRLDQQIDALSLINTLEMSDVLPDVPLPYGVEWAISGAPIKQRALAAVRRVVSAGYFKGRLIGGGGIMTVEDLYEFLYAGVNAASIMTGLRFDHSLQSKAENTVSNFDRCPEPLGNRRFVLPDLPPGDSI